MRRVSHRILGRYLAEKKLSDTSSICRRAFKIGNSIPDYNVLTYLKGWKIKHLRGHNFPNSEKYLNKLVNKLEDKEHFGIFSYYKLGILMHYVTDAFTFAHNNSFMGSLYEHHLYEEELHQYFRKMIEDMKDVIIFNSCFNGGVMDIVNDEHVRYEDERRSIEVDARYIIKVVNLVMQSLLDDIKVKPQAA